MSLPLVGLFALLSTVTPAQSSDTPPLVVAVQSSTSGAPSTPQSPGAAAPLSTPPLPSSADPCAAAEADYTEAFEELVKGRDRRALEALERVLATCPSHPYAGEFARMVRSRLGPGAKLAEAALGGPERPTGFARGGLVVWQTLHGAAQGVLLCGIAGCGDRGYLGTALGGAALGATASWLLSDRGVTPGQSAVINSGTSWGVWYGLAAIQVFDITDGDGPLGVVMASMAALTGAGVGLALAAPPTAGQVSMANSGGLWAGVVTALFLATADDGDNRTFFGIESIATGAGLTTFAILSRQYPASRGRILLIDAGGILGGLLGASLPVLFGAEGDPILISSGVGVLGGLALTTVLTSDFDAEAADEPQVSLLPTLGEHGAGLVLGGRF